MQFDYDAFVSDPAGVESKKKKMFFETANQQNSRQTDRLYAGRLVSLVMSM